MFSAFTKNHKLHGGGARTKNERLVVLISLKAQYAHEVLLLSVSNDHIKIASNINIELLSKLLPV